MTSLQTLELQPDTTQIVLLQRYTGANKNATIVTPYLLLKEWVNLLLRVPRLPVWPPWPGWPFPPAPQGDVNVPVVLPPNYPISLPDNPPGESVGPIVPPQQLPPPEPISAASPTLVEWPEPNRPDSAGTLLEAKHDFESALPAQWTTVTSGNGSLARIVGTSLAGNGYMRSVKSVAGP